MRKKLRTERLRYFIMSKKNKQKRNTFFQTLFTVLVTLLVVAVITVISYGFRTLGFSAHTVSYTSAETESVGILPEKRQFEKGDEVVVRAGNISKKDSVFLGWKDVNSVIASAPNGVLENGAVFIMPDKDVVLEAVWEEKASSSDNESPNPTDKTSTGSSSSKEIFHKRADKDYINIRSDYGHDSEVVTKIRSSDTELEYSGKSHDLFDEDDQKTYTWYYVTVPSDDSEGWVRSDMLDSNEKDKSTDSSNDEKYDTYIKSDKYDIISMFEEPDSSSKVVEKITDDKTELYFTNKTKKTEDSDGKTTTWYNVDSQSGKSGWVQSQKVEKSKSGN